MMISSKRGAVGVACKCLETASLKDVEEAESRPFWARKSIIILMITVQENILQKENPRRFSLQKDLEKKSKWRENKAFRLRHSFEAFIWGIHLRHSFEGKHSRRTDLRSNFYSSLHTVSLSSILVRRRRCRTHKDSLNKHSYAQVASCLSLPVQEH